MAGRFGKQAPICNVLLALCLSTALAASLSACNLRKAAETPAATLPALTQAIPTPPASPTSQAFPLFPTSTGQPALLTPLPTPDENLTKIKVAYLKDGNIWLWQDGSPSPLTNQGDAYALKISPDGKLVAYLRQVNAFHAEIWAVEISGENERRLVSISDLDTIGGGVRDANAVAINPYHMEWIPGTHRLAFNTHQVFDGPGLVLLNDLNTVDAITGELNYVLLSGWGGEFVFSPDGGQVALSTPDAILLADADGSSYRKVLDYAPVTTYSEYRYYAAPVWSPDGTFLRVAIPPADPLADPRQPTALWRIDLDGAPAYQVGSLSATPFFDTPVSFSPDCSLLVYLLEYGPPADNQRELHIAKADGSGDWVYQKGRMLRFYGWSPDSRRFVFSVGEDQQAQIGSLDAAAQPFTGEGVNIFSVNWIDEQTFLFVQQKNRAFDLSLATLEGELLTLDTIIDTPPALDF
ncbi:MAG: hypothetical protein JXB15_02660 [Anaerolineales bacterium]|nr:hypothetical protein [Anaerolineales bacterium]